MRRTSIRAGSIAVLSAGALALSACAPPAGAPVAWESARAAGANTVVVELWGRPPLGGSGDFCGSDYSAAASENASRVAITVLERRNPPPFVPVACPAIARRVELPVTLSAPVGSRTLIDGATGEPKKLS